MKVWPTYEICTVFCLAPLSSQMGFGRTLMMIWQNISSFSMTAVPPVLATLSKELLPFACDRPGKHPSAQVMNGQAASMNADFRGKDEQTMMNQ